MEEIKLLELKLNEIPDIGSEPSKKNFRLNAKHLFLTYSQTILEKEEAFVQLNDILPIKNYIISKEPHQEGGFHLHVYLELSLKVNITNCSKLDLLDLNQKICHGNYQSMKNRKATIAYLTKTDHNCLTSLNLNSFGEEKTREDEFYEKISLIAKNDGYEIALKYFCELRPDLIPKNYKSIKRNLIQYCEDNTESIKARYPIESFNIPDSIKNWIKFEKDFTTLVLTGKPNTGKTELIISLFESEGLKPLLVRNINSLKFLKKINKSIIFDDVDFEKFSPEELIHLFDKTHNSDIKILYQIVTIDKDIVKAVTKNTLSSILRVYDDLHDAILRRLKIVEINEPLFIQQNNFYINNLNIVKEENIVGN